MNFRPTRLLPFIAIGFLVFSFAVPSRASALSLTQNHQLWDTGPDILSLQQWLNANGYPLTQSGIGSPGNETDSFGPLTLDALTAFQQANGLPATGYLGPLTRAKIDALSVESNSTGLTDTQTQAILSLLQSFGADQSVVTSVETALGMPADTSTDSTFAPAVPISIPAIPGGYTPGFGGGGSTSNSNTSTPDTTVPTVSLTAPSSGATLSGTSVTLTATASDNVAVANVQFEVDGTNIGSAITSSPYTTTWNSTTTTDGTHTLYAVAEDTSGNYATSSISVTVENSAPVISSISSGTPGQTSATITWTTDQSSNSEVVYGTTTGYGSASSSASNVTSHSLTLTGLTASTTYDYEVVSTNVGSQTSTSTNQTFTTASAGADTTPPTEPTDLVAVAASLSELDLSWTASSDNVGVTGYQIFRDGTQVATDTSGTTYADTGLAASSTQTYVVKAYDAAGNVSSASNTATSTTGVWADGYAGAPSGTPEVPTLLDGYAIRPPWHVPAVDYYVGYPSGTVLKDPTASTLPGCATYNSSTYEVTVNSNNCTLNGYDFTKAGGIEVYIPSVSGTVIENSLFGASANAFSDNALIDNRSANTTIIDNTFENDAQNNEPYFDTSASGTTTIEYNYFYNIDQDAMDFDSNETIIVRYNACVQIGMSVSSHPDCVQLNAGTLGAGSEEAFNLSYQPVGVVQTGAQGIQIAAQDGGVNTGYSADHNTVIASSSTSPTMSYSVFNNSSGVSILDNYIDSTGSTGAFYPDGNTSDTCAGNVAMTNAHGYTGGSFISGTFSGSDGSMTCTGEPALSSISTTPTTTSATITWTTDEPSTSEVVFGTTSSYGAASSTATLVTSHSIAITDLATSTTYHYAVVSTDADGHTSTSTDSTFSTSSGGSGGCSQATAFLARVSVDGTHQSAYTTLICSLVTSGVWSKLDILYIFATQNSTAGLTNLTSGTYSATATGTPTFTTNQGFTTGTNKWIDTGFNLSTGTNFTQNSASFGVWNLTSGSSYSAALQAATAYGGLNYLRPNDADYDGSASAQVNASAATSSNPGTVTTGAGLDLAIRPDSTQYQIWQNTTELVDFLRGSAPPDNADLETAGDNTAGNNTGAYQLAAIFAGAALSSSDVSNFYSAMHTYMQTIAGVP
jgi:hypothetical protein